MQSPGVTENYLQFDEQQHSLSFLEKQIWSTIHSHGPCNTARNSSEFCNRTLSELWFLSSPAP